ncbi:hypothetical protein vseg_012711 [Gypsophila vaccaria]
MENKGELASNSSPCKVRLIDTRNVVVDAREFKSVVQSLTGRNSSVAWIESNFAETSSCDFSRKKLKRKLDVGLTFDDSGRVQNKSNGANRNRYMTLGDHECKGNWVGEPNVLESSNSNSKSNRVENHVSMLEIDPMLEFLQLMEGLENWPWSSLN